MHRILFFIVAVMMFATHAKATNYYVSYATGDDSATGLTGAPFKTMAKAWAIMQNMTDGDGMFFNRGEEWPPSTVPNLGNDCFGCVVDAYGTGDAPILTLAHTDTTFIYLDDADGWTFRNFTAHCYTGTDEFSWFAQVYIGSSNNTFEYLTVNNCTHGVILNGTEDGWGGANNTDNNTMQHSTFNDNAGTAFLGGHGSYNIIDNNDILRGGWGNPTFNHSIYWSSMDKSRITNNRTLNSNSHSNELTVTAITKANPAVATSAGHGIVTGDKAHFKEMDGMHQLNHHYFTLTRLTDDTFSIDGVDSTGYDNFVSGEVWVDEFSCGGVIVVGHGKANELIIANNTLYEEPDTASGGCYGMTFDAAYAAERGAEEFVGMTVTGNRLSNLGNIYVGFSNSQDVEIGNNKIYHDNNNAFITAFNHGGGNTPDPLPAIQNNDVTIYNNTIVVVDDSGNNVQYSAGIDMGQVPDVVTYDNTIIFADTQTIPCTRLLENEYTSTNDVCVLSSGVTASAVYVEETLE